ncbi:MAG: CPBP family intramembrane metalloprotease [Bacteroidales bacterium]|nr:CPBP family intramembrane metalloprotease [Bacteroidales bacterium]
MFDKFFQQSLAFRIVLGCFAAAVLSFLLFAVLYAIAPENNGLNGLQLITHSVLDNRDRMCILYMLSIETVCIFLVPAWILLTAIYRSPLRTLRCPSRSDLPLTSLLIVILLLTITNIPGINLMSELNTDGIVAIIGKDSALWLNYLKMETFTEQLISSEMFCINILCMALIPAVCEEIFFRGFMQTVATDVFRNVHAAILVTALIFSILHGDVFNFIPRFVLGLLLGYLYIYAGTILIPIIAHLLHNTLVVLGLNLSEASSIIETIGTTDNKPLMGVASLLILSGFIILIVKKIKAE